jgi:hypothetical protein
VDTSLHFAARLVQKRPCFRCAHIKMFLITICTCSVGLDALKISNFQRSLCMVIKFACKFRAVGRPKNRPRQKYGERGSASLYEGLGALWLSKKNVGKKFVRGGCLGWLPQPSYGTANLVYDNQTVHQYHLDFSSDNAGFACKVRIATCRY